MKITILMGSPRTNGNSAYLAERFAQGAEEAGHETFIFDCAKHEIGGCLGCGSCGMDGPCVRKDGFALLRPHVIEADMLVFASPVYYFGFTAQLKAAIDRFYSIHAKLGGKKCALIAVMGNPSPKVAAPAVAMYEDMAAYLHWQDMGRVLAAGVWAAGDARRSAYGEQAYRLGRSIN